MTCLLQVRTEFYRDMQGILLAYDVTDRSSFIALDAWLAELRHNLGSWVAVVWRVCVLYLESYITKIICVEP